MNYELINKVATINCDDNDRKELFLALEKQIPVKPVIMQLAEPEYMCPECGNKFYVYGEKRKYCSECGRKYIWE